MSGYLSLVQISACAPEVVVEYERLLANRRIVMRPRSKQWAFLRHCFAITLAARSADYPISRAQGLQYRFEVEDKLRRYYLSPGGPLSYIFTLFHRDRALSLGLVTETYPVANGYVLLVAAVNDGPAHADNERDLLERVIAEAAEAEWAVYQKLPELDLRPLERCFRAGAPAFKRIQHLAERHHERRWTLTQPRNNPSTRRMIDVRVVKLGNSRAEVRTKEYWYLRWYSLARGDYAKIDWRETNTQTYILVRDDDRWLVEDNIYPPPRSAAPHRRGIIVG